MARAPRPAATARRQPRGTAGARGRHCASATVPSAAQVNIRFFLALGGQASSGPEAGAVSAEGKAGLEAAADGSPPQVSPRPALPSVSERLAPLVSTSPEALRASRPPGSTAEGRAEVSQSRSANGASRAPGYLIPSAASHSPEQAAGKGMG